MRTLVIYRIRVRRGLSGTLWNDSEPDGSDGDGIQDASEVGLGGIPVSVTNVFTGEVVSTTTAPDGSYVFSGLAAVFDTGTVLSDQLR